MTRQPEWDYIVVGGGTAGCVLAGRLAERGGARVLVLEAGGAYAPLLLSTPLPSLRQITAFSWRYFTTQQAGLARRRVSMPVAKVLGGGSSTNAMMYQRGSPACYDAWAALGNPGWSFRELLPYFKKFENYRPAGPPDHGDSGPVHISRPRYIAPFSRAFVEACAEIGVPAAGDLDCAGGQAAGYFRVTQSAGRRVSSATAYLRSGTGRPGIAAITGAHASRLVLDGARAAGVEYVRDGRREVARAAGEIILCAGSINSPKFLMLSGIGPADHLASVGIATAVDLPGVGENLQDHPRAPVLFESGRGSPGDMKHWIPHALLYAAARKGVMASNCCESGALMKSCASKPSPDLQFVTHFQSSLYPGAVDMELCLMTPQSRGAVRLQSADPMDPPLIDPGYLREESDVRALVSGVRIARKIAHTNTMRGFPLRRELLPGAEIATDREIADYIRTSVETCFHPTGTCKMGSDRLAVVDADLKVRGVEGLRVADASIMPEIVDGNTCAAALLIAEKAADLVKSAGVPPPKLKAEH
ncbi:MAG: GMC family oxidoreductase N-terminal domain-containing protein [Bryobacteraceae bacterium]|nr:GMC family oxidoreductase N-terminal domain-containing protein [Bryobacteraceae bacterium]